MTRGVEFLPRAEGALMPGGAGYGSSLAGSDNPATC